MDDDTKHKLIMSLLMAAVIAFGIWGLWWVLIHSRVQM